MTLPTLDIQFAATNDPLDATYSVLVLPNGTAVTPSTPDAAGLDVAGDIEFVARVSLTDWTPSAAQVIVSKGAYQLEVATTGALTVKTKSDASTTVSQTSSVGPWANGETWWVKATLDVDDGAGNRVHTFYYAADRELEPYAWTLLSTHTTAGTTSIYNNTQALYVGSDAGTANWMVGSIYRVIIRSGIGGTRVADFDPTDRKKVTATSMGSTRVPGQTWSSWLVNTSTTAPYMEDGISWLLSMTGYTRDGVTISRGKQSEIETYASSSMALTLSNRNRYFDPDYTGASGYKGNIKPRKRIRALATWNNTTYTLWTGFVDSWTQRFPMANFDAITEVSAYDTLALLNDEILDDPGYLYATETIPNLALYLRYVSNGVWTDIVNGVQYRRRTGTESVGDSLGSAPSDSVNFDGSTYWSYGPPNVSGKPSSGTFTGVSLSCWFKTSSIDTTNVTTLFGSRSDTATIIKVGIKPNGAIYYNNNNGATVAWSTGSWADGKPHHLVITHESSTVKIYVDGVDCTDPASTPLAARNSSRINMIGKLYGASDTDNAWFNGSISDIGYWNTTMTAAQAANLYRLSLGKFVESTGARATRVLNLAGVPAGLQNITDISRGEVGEFDLYGSSALSQLQSCADSEAGRLFADREGRVTLLDRFWWDSGGNGSTVQATFSDDLGDLYYTDVGSDLNLREVQNRIVVTAPNGATFTATDATSIASYGTRSGSISTLLSSQEQVESLATGLVALRKDPISRLEAITVRPAMQDSAWPTVLGLELGDRVTFEIMPARGAATTTQVVKSLIIERLDWTIGQSDWVLKITGSPIPTQQMFMLDSSQLDGSDVLGF